MNVNILHLDITQGPNYNFYPQNAIEYVMYQILKKLTQHDDRTSVHPLFGIAIVMPTCTFIIYII